MSNELTVLGFGQCGSKIAIDIAATFNPASVLGLLEGASPFTLSIRAVIERFHSPSDIERNRPRIYIADLNEANDIYTKYRKTEAIRSQNFPSRLTTKDKIHRVNIHANATGVELKDEDGALVEYVEKNRRALEMVNALYFSAGNSQVLRTGGVGGLQYVSEAIADQDDALFNAIRTSENAPLVGVFALGGGTGSGSLYSVLTRYKSEYQRYTVGVGILPMTDNKLELDNAGRYITKFLGASKESRFHTLLLFSNEVAIRLLQRAKLPRGQSPLDIVNTYVASFIHAFSLLADKGTTTLFGKLLDPADCKRFFSDVCTIGYAAAECSAKFSAKETFINAISPLSYLKNGDIAGVAVSTSPTNQIRGSDVDSLGDMVAKVINSLERGDPVGMPNDDVEQLRENGTFYRTVKVVHALFFLKSKDHEYEVFHFQRTIVDFFKMIAGDGVSVAVHAYHASALDRSSVLVMFGGSFCHEVYESVRAYVCERFISGDDNRRRFLNAYVKILKEVRTPGTRKEDDGLEEQVKEILDDVCDDKRRSEMLDQTPDYFGKGSVAAVFQKRRPRRVTRKAVCSVLVDIARRFRPVAMVPQSDEDPFP